MLHRPLLHSSVACIAACLLGTPSALSQQTTQPTTKERPRAGSKVSALEAQVQSHVDSLSESGSDADYRRVITRLTQLMDHVLATTTPATVATPTAAQAAALQRFVVVAANLRLVKQLAACPQASRVSLLAELRAHPAALEATVFAIDDAKDDPAKVYALLSRLIAKYPAEVDALPNLAAAVSVVHDLPWQMQLNENTAKAADPVEIFGYFARNRRKLAIDPATLPTELLVHLVDTTATIDEMDAALAKYGKTPTVGDRYSEIKYDNDAFLKSVPKKCTTAPGGWNMAAIAKYGGVCVDQAYYACMVGKAQGIPTAYVVGKAAAISHAWMGYLRAQGNRYTWDFSTGRYDEYKDIRGSVQDPQTRVSLADGHIAILADAAAQKKDARIQSLALLEGARRLTEVQEANIVFPPPQVQGVGEEAFVDDFEAPGKADPLKPDSASRQLLIEAALRRTPSNVRAWDQVKSLARFGALDYDDKVRWAEVLFSLCGKSYADFSLDVVRPMIETQEPVEQQAKLWDATFKTYAHRPDLASLVRLAQGEMWEKAGNKTKAWDAYQDVIRRFVNEGPYAVSAATHIEQLLRSSGKDANVAEMYEGAYRKAVKPKRGSPEFLRGSNWFQLGFLYAGALMRDGKTQEASKVLTELGVDPAMVRLR
jgi:hypothetical protein